MTVQRIRRLVLGERIDGVELPYGVEIRRSARIPEIARWFLGTGSRAAAVTLGSTIVVHPETRLSDALVRHELAHVRQWRHRPLTFPLVYVWHHFRHGYRNNPFELEAREAEMRPDRRRR